MRTTTNFPPGWDKERVQRVLRHYESQDEDEAVAEDEAAFEDATQTVMEIPNHLNRANNVGRLKRSEIIARRREFVIPGYGYKTLAEVGFDGEWVTPIQKKSHSKTGPVLICKDWLDWPSVHVHRVILKKMGYLPTKPFNRVLDLALEHAKLTRRDIYVTQAFHLLPPEPSYSYPPQHLYESFGKITQYEAEGRTVIALGGDAQRVCRHFGVEHIQCIHPSARGLTVDAKAEMLAEALLATSARIPNTVR